jgi:hypothetical protein
MTEYNEQQIAALAKRYATGRLDRGNNLQLFVRINDNIKANTTFDGYIL